MTHLLQFTINVPKSQRQPNSVRLLFVGLREERSLQKKGGYTSRIARSHFGCREDQLRRTTRDFQTRDESCAEVDSGIFEHLL